MSDLKRKILDVLFWIALAVGVIMIIWRIFGKSPSDLVIITPFIVMLTAKILNVSDELKNFRYYTKLSFIKFRENINRIENKISS